MFGMDRSGGSTDKNRVRQQFLEVGRRR